MASIVVVEDLAAPSVSGRGGHATWVLQVLNGLASLGHRVTFVEYLQERPDESVVDDFGRLMARYWPGRPYGLLLEPTLESLTGLNRSELERVAQSTDAVLTLASHYRREPWPLFEDVRPRILFEQDPGYTHVWASGGDPIDIFGQHDVYFTVGGNVGRPGNQIPTLGLDWHHAWNPVVLDWWSGAPRRGDYGFTTVGAWRDYGYFEFNGSLLGPKVEEFAKFVDLPSRVPDEQFTLALAIDGADPDVELLAKNGWVLEPPSCVSTPAQYKEFIFASKGEFSCAKGGYVGTRSGWFSDRSACYLAAGRPVVLQATGFEELLPTGLGLYAVGDVQEAADAVAQIVGDYEANSRAARGIAREHFDSSLVLRELLDQSGVQ